MLSRLLLSLYIIKVQIINLSCAAREKGEVLSSKKYPVGTSSGVRSRKLRRQTGPKGPLMCAGKSMNDSEVVYWRWIPDDLDHISPLAAAHDEKVLIFHLDRAGSNNVRLGLETVIVTAHAMGRTLVLPPRDQSIDHLKGLKKQRGMQVSSMAQFLKNEAQPKLSENLQGTRLWEYIDEAADFKPAWWNRVLALPENMIELGTDGGARVFNSAPTIRARLEHFAKGRQIEYYTKKMQDSRLLFIPSGSKNASQRILQHHYSFNFFADPNEQSFYKRFVRDRVRYKDEYHCAALELLGLLRGEIKGTSIVSSRQNISDFRLRGLTGTRPFAALHVRRSDFSVQYPSTIISAADIVQNLHGLIPRGEVVYVATDDPRGVCEGCRSGNWDAPLCGVGDEARGREGCLEDPSWNAFKDAGWKIRFLGDYLPQSTSLKHMDPSLYGIVEALICARSEVFAGTFLSTYSGFIHLIRGYHGLGEQTYYHTNGHRDDLRSKVSIGQGWPREWRYGWTDDGGTEIR